MGIRIFRTMNEYIKHINDIEQSSFSTLVASSFLSSYLFPKSIVLRFFEKDLGRNQSSKDAANNLWQRRKRVHSNIKKAPYKELYEIDAFEEFCKKGIVHRQMPNFKATPKEIIEVLQTMLSLLQNHLLYEIGFCQEQLPFIFIIKAGNGLTIDVRNNFGYQQIQGLLIEDDDIITEFQKEFLRIWKDDLTVSNKNQVISLIEKKIAFVKESGHLLSDK